MDKQYQGGYSFFNTYHTCQRQFWFKYVLKWETEEKSEKMIWGNVIHRMRSLFAQESFDPSEEWSPLFDKVVKEEGLSDADLINRAYQLLQMWIDLYWKEDQEWKGAYFDELMGIDIDGFLFLIKPDRVDYHSVRDEYRIIEVKTTQYSAGVILSNLQLTHQSTAYIWGWNQKFPERRISTVIPEVFYSRGKVYDVKRGTPVYRNAQQLNRFEQNLRFWIGEICYKLQSNEKYPDKSGALFPRKFGCTEGSNFKCPYESICSSTNIVHNPEDPPMTFQVRKRKEVIKDGTIQKS